MLTREITALDISAIEHFPQATAKTALEAASKSVALSLHSTIWYGLANRSRGIAGVLGELDRIAEMPASPAFEAFLGRAQAAHEAKAPNTIAVPALLSRSQKSLIESAHTSPLTVCHGPPGTGKSFTIACLALDAAMRGESVLLTSRNDEAVDVIEEKMNELADGQLHLARGGRGEHLRRLKGFVDDCLSGAVLSHAPYKSAVNESKKLRTDYAAMRDKLAAQIDLRLQAEQDYAQLHQSDARGLLHRFRKWRARRAIAHGPDLEQLYADYLNAEETLLAHLATDLPLQLNQQLCVALRSMVTRNELADLRSALAKRRSSEQEAAMREVDLPRVKGVLPIWLAGIYDIHRILPLAEPTFDLVVIDEASQCDLASVIPALQRAKRAVILGDPQQLRHVSFLSREQMADLASRAGATDIPDFRKTSALDAAITVTQRTGSSAFLDEHFRGPDGLISFNNATYYVNRLRMMHVTNTTLPVFHEVEGERDAANVNHAEVRAVLGHLRRLVAEKTPRSIGVLSPLRDQREALAKAIGEDAELLAQLTNRHDLRVGTPFEFQGSERDVMLLSLALDARSSATAFRYLESPGVLNVATSRAREEMHIYLSFTAQHCGPQLGGFLQHLHQTHESTGRVLGIAVDAFDPATRTVIDRIGYPDGKPALAREQVLVLHRAGLRYMPQCWRG